MTNRLKTPVLTGLAAPLALILASCASQPAPRHVATRAPIARAAPTPAPMASAAPAAAERSLAAEAAAFESFMRHARGIDPAFAGPSEVSQALQTAAAHEPHEFEAGMVAYAALAALQEPRFVAALNAEKGRAERDRGELSRRLVADPQAVLAIPAADAAAARAAGALYAQGSGLATDGEKVKHAAYTLQKQAWSKTTAPDHAGELAQVKRISQAAYRPGREDDEALRAALALGPRRPGAPSPAVTRGVALAALSVLGEEARGRSLMSEPRTGSCLHMAKLNLYQCLASAGPRYEDVYCLGQHAMIDTGQCVVEATRAPRQVASR
ncbi:hypothetical protein [Phenylobacterium sp.]|jgi:hypothetical protein|uniref:hypothetical protein n=1 Tax=Phenylobacterium sp. TaxID=1871053 RepID=UPI002F411CFD